MSRSVALASAAAIPAIASPALAAPLAGEPGLAELIEAHKAAYTRAEDTAERFDDAEWALNKDRRENPILVPLAVLPNGHLCGGACEFGVLTSDEVRERIEGEHIALRQRFCSKFLRETLPDFAVVIEREIEASQARALQALANAEAAMEERGRRFGVNVADEAFCAASDDECAARLALLLFVPRNEREAAIKRAYIDTARSFSDGACETEEFVEAMLDRLCRVPAGAGMSTAA